MTDWSAMHDEAVVLMMLSSSPAINPSGYGVRSHAIASHLVGHGVKLEVFTKAGYPYNTWSAPKNFATSDQVENVTYKYLPLYPVGMGEFGETYRAHAANLVASVAKRCEAKIIHAASDMENGLPAMMAAQKIGVPGIYEYRGMWHYTSAARNTWFPWTEPFQRRQKLELQCGQMAAAVFAISEALKADLVDHGLPEEKITVLPNSVDARRFVPLAPDQELLDKYNLAGRTVIGFIGSFTAYEGLESLMDAVLELNWRGHPVSLLLVGDGGDYLGRLKTLHKARGSHPAIVFTGRVPFAEVNRYYSLVDIMPFPRIPAKVCQCVPPLKPLEAMAMGKAVLVSNVAALTEIVQDGVTGLVCKSGNLRDLVEKLELLVTQKALRETLASQGRSWALTERDWAKTSERILRVYERLLAQQRGN